MNRASKDLPSPDLSLLLLQLVLGHLCDDVGSLLAHARADLGLTEEVPPSSAALNGVEALSRRLALARACWGPATPRLTGRDIANLAERLPGAHRLRLDLSGLPRRMALSALMGRVVLNVLMLASESLPRGGVIAITEQADGILISMNGTHAGWPREFSRLVDRPEAAWAALSTPKRVLPPLVVMIAAQAGIHLSFQTSPRSSTQVIPALLLSAI